MSLPTELPIFSIIPQLRETLRKKRSVVLSAPPGSGKTTVVPLVLLAEQWLAGRSILILEPRRLAARMAAERMAAIIEEPVGQTVGYRVRFDSTVSPATRIEVVTEGILTRRLQNDPELAETGLVIFDEFHERSLHADLALALCLDVMSGLRSDLKILIMSATLDTESITGLLDNAGAVRGEGREHPVDIRYGEERVDRSRYGIQTANGFSFQYCVEGMRRAIIEAARREQGDILAFLPGTGEIKHTARLLSEWAAAENIALFPLHGSLPREMQDKAVQPDPAGKRRLILATSIAETSLTIEGVRIVLDSGWSRVQRFDPNSGLSRLITVRVSMASARQRSGRAGRTQPGVCYRLWNKRIDQELKPHSRPEILDGDLAPLVLELAHWGVAAPEKLQWLDPPPQGHYAQAVDLLTALGALDGHGRITPRGKRMAAFPVHPRLACMLAAAELGGGTEKACDIAALLTERDIFRSGEGTRPVDIGSRLQILADYRDARARKFSRRHVDAPSCAAVDKAARQYRGILQKRRGSTEIPTVGMLLAFAYPDRIAQRRTSSHNRYVLANGRGAILPDGDYLINTPYLVAADIDAGRADGRIFLAASITEDEISSVFRKRIQRVEKVCWDTRREEVTMAGQERLQEIVLSSYPLADVDQEDILRAMLEGIRQMGPEGLPWSGAARTLQARILLLREHCPEFPWPDCSDEAIFDDLAGWLAPYLSGITSRRGLAGLDMGMVLSNKLDWDLRQQLDTLAPTHIRVPSGSRKRIRYADGSPPVLAVRLQELFGLRDTPSICRGRVKVVLHLLSPAQRPIQVTRDLRGFWDRTYPEVKKELKGRYPRHPWPDDPWTAVPTSRTQSKRKNK